MKNLKYLFLVLILTACEKKKDAPRDLGGIPGGGTTVITQYAGVIASNKQDVTTNADVINHPTDMIDSYLCKNVVCSVDSLPSLNCAVAAPGAACFTTIPGPNIIWGVNIVRFLYGVTNGFSSYAIKTIVTR